MLPQQILIAASEILITVTGLTFSYTQAPPNMKTFTIALWFSARGLGKVLYQGFEHISDFNTETIEIFLYAGCMVVATIIFIVLTWWYHQAEHRKETEEVLT